MIFFFYQVFTGLIQSLGSIKALGQDRWEVGIAKQGRDIIIPTLEIGDSVAVDGICLTVEEILSDAFVASVSPETLERSTLGQTNLSAPMVNLETSMRIGSKLGGHFVTGHVDGIGCLLESTATERAWEMRFGASSKFSQQWHRYIARYLVVKGSVAVNGISLTIADCDTDGSWFSVAVIPHTYQATNLIYLEVGSLVNIESDILGKYVDKILSHRLVNYPEEEITMDFLGENGYL